MATHEIGFPIDFSTGTHDRTMATAGGSLQLEEVGTGVYTNQGVWTSEVLKLDGKYTSLENLALTATIGVGQSYKAYTRTSDDGLSWGEYVEINYGTGKMQSVPKVYVQVKVELFSGTTTSTPILYSGFATQSEILENEFVQSESGLRLRTNYNYTMNNEAWVETGDLHRYTIDRLKYKRIDSINIS